MDCRVKPGNDEESGRVFEQARIFSPLPAGGERPARKSAPGEGRCAVRSPHEAKRNAGFARTGDEDQDCAALHPGYACCACYQKTHSLMVRSVA